MRRSGRGRPRRDVGGAPAAPEPLYALSDFSGASDHFVAASAAGGEAGLASGWGIAIVWMPRTLAAVTQALASHRSSNTGWRALWTSANDVRVDMNDGAFKVTPLHRLTVRDVGRVHVTVGILRGAELLQWTDGLRVPGSTAIGVYVPSSADSAFQLFGMDASFGSPAADRMGLLGVLVFHGTPSDADIAALFDHVRELGDLPDTMDGATITHLWSARRALVGAGAVVDGQVAPAAIEDAVSGLELNRMARVGSPKVRRIETGNDGLETRGVHGFTATEHLATAPNEGMRGDAAGFWAACLWRPNAQGTGTIEYLLNTVDGTSNLRGWGFYTNSGMTAVQFVASSSQPALVSSPAYTITPGDVGQILLLLGVHDGTHVRLYVRRAEVGSGSAISGYTPAFDTVPVRYGLRADGLASLIAARSSLFGGEAGLGVPTEAERNALFDSFERTRRIPEIPGKTNMLHDFTEDIATPDVPATFADLRGASSLARQGSGLQVSRHCRRVWSYEREPILYGAVSPSLNDYYAAAPNALPGDASGFTVTILARLLTQAVASGSRYLASQRSSANQGWSFLASGTNGSVIFGAGGNTTAANSPGANLTASDVGKLHVFTGVWDGSAVRLYTKRLQVGTGSALSGGYEPQAAVAPMLARRESGTQTALDGWAIEGLSYQLGAATLAQSQAQHDHILASERIQLVPGLASGTLIDIDLDTRAAGNVSPATLTDRSTGGAHFARLNTLSVDAMHARAWA